MGVRRKIAPLVAQPDNDLAHSSSVIFAVVPRLPRGTRPQTCFRSRNLPRTVSPSAGDSKVAVATESRDAFGLLNAVGRDCAGAVQLLPEGEGPGEIQTVRAEPLGDRGVERAIGAALPGSRVPGQADDEEFRISIAGAQEKIALLRHQDQWCRPLGTAPTTHILRLPLGAAGNLPANLLDSVENEWLCLPLKDAFGLDTARAEIKEFITRKVLVGERFERPWQGNTWSARRARGDYCRALGRPGPQER